MRDERAEYIKTICELDGDVAGRKRALDAIASSDAWAYGVPVAFPYVPYLFNETDLERIYQDMQTMHRILCKVIDRYLSDPAYRELFGFSPELERLIMLPCGYNQLLPIGRLDIFLDESDFSYKFCEFNTDGSGAMSRAAVTNAILRDSEPFKRFASKHEVEDFEFFDNWVRAFMNIYRSDTHAVDNPHIAVTDFEESGVFSDFNRFIAAFERAGIPARFVDTRSFEFDGKQLIDPSDGQRIDAIYRRAVTSELLQHPGECDALIDAVAAEKVCLIGHFRTTVVHSKVVNIALFDKRTTAFLDDEENAFVEAHVPRTYLFESGQDGFTLEEIKANKDAWILKPADDYGAHGVFPGVDFSQDEWERIVDDNLDSGYIVQEFYQPPYVELINTHIDEDDPCRVERWQSMPGVYLYDGEPVGFYCRLGRKGVIALDHGGLCSGAFLVKS